MLKIDLALYEEFSDSQKEMLATPSYKIRKDKKAGLLISPKDVKVLHPVDDKPTFQSQPSSAHASAQPATCRLPPLQLPFLQ